MSPIIIHPGCTIREMEKLLTLNTLKFYRGNKTQTAQVLGISIRTLDTWLEEYELEGQERAKIEAREVKRRQFHSDRERGKISLSQTFEEYLGETKTSAGLRVEPAVEVSEEQHVPVPVGNEVQKVLPRKAAKSGSEQRRRDLQTSNGSASSSVSDPG